MKKFIKYGSIVVISLVILISCNVNSYDCDVFAEEKNEEQNTETDIICNWPEDIIDPGPALPQYLSASKIMNILNTYEGIKVQWKKVNNAHGYRIQRKLGNSKWKDLKILKENQYTDKTVENGKKYQSKIKEISTYKFNPKIYGMKKKKSYYVRIRAYKVDGKQLHYSAWSNIKILK